MSKKSNFIDNSEPGLFECVYLVKIGTGKRAQIIQEVFIQYAKNLIEATKFSLIDLRAKYMHEKKVKPLEGIISPINDPLQYATLNDNK